MEFDARLAALQPLGGFFVLRTGEPPHGPLPTLAEAYAPAVACARDPRSATGDTRGATGDTRTATGDPLADRVRRVAEGIAAPEARVAASVAQQALAARLWSVALGCAVRYGRIPDLDPRLLRWDPAGSAPDDLWLTAPRPGAGGDAASVAEAVLHGHLRPLAAALRARHRLAPGLLWGNAASALAGAARQLARSAHELGRPDTGERARTLAARILTHPLLVGTGTVTGTDFRRRSCCLYYRVPGGGVCGDCCFTRPPRSPRPRPR
ncbi:(2Fe-2S)-binding protein [Streptomyces mexicanus]|uniref:(2Fe-2S)-binding protein n=2 Tax=Streptomyces mexicanus TaxID=178566 RepID=A0A7X1I0X6_9ACTN|nr:(2Fe-2S)-binding protein [Streptomyces mexicanus]